MSPSAARWISNAKAPCSNTVPRRCINEPRFFAPAGRASLSCWLVCLGADAARLAGLDAWPDDLGQRPRDLEQSLESCRHHRSAGNPMAALACNQLLAQASQARAANSRAAATARAAGGRTLGTAPTRDPRPAAVATSWRERQPASQATLVPAHWPTGRGKKQPARAT